MTTKRLRISDAAIKKHQGNDAIKRLRDERYPLEFRYHKSRESGSWYLIDKRKNNGRNGKARWDRLGRWPQLKASVLFELLPKTIGLVALNQESVMSEWATFGDCLSWYLQHVDGSRQITHKRKLVIKSAVIKHLLPALNSMPLNPVKKYQIKNALIWPLQAEHEVRTVKSYFSVLKAAFKQAAREELLETNPLADMQFSDFIQTPTKPKEGRLLPQMVNPLFDHLKTLRLKESMLVIMQLAHGTRLGETRRARWSQIDWQERVWRLPGANTKSREPHVIPLTEQVLALLRRYRKTQHDDAVLLFPSQTKRHTPISANTATAIYRDASQGEWSSHDCRKLARTRWADLGVDKFVAERLLNHKLSDLDQAYIHTTTETLKREALELYHAWLDDQGFFIFHGTTVGRSKKQTQAIEAAGWL